VVFHSKGRILRVIENRALKRIFGPEREEVAFGCRSRSFIT
jgi:hypothetical protein